MKLQAGNNSSNGKNKAFRIAQTAAEN